jgi:hypothetical protein
MQSPIPAREHSPEMKTEICSERGDVETDTKVDKMLCLACHVGSSWCRLPVIAALLSKVSLLEELRLISKDHYRPLDSRQAAQCQASFMRYNCP